MPTLPQHPGAWARVTARIRDPVCGSNRKGRDLFEPAVWGQAGALGAARWGSASQGTPPAGLWKGNGVGSSQPEPLRAPASAHGPAAPPSPGASVRGPAGDQAVRTGRGCSPASPAAGAVSRLSPLPPGHGAWAKSCSRGFYTSGEGGCLGSPARPLPLASWARCLLGWWRLRAVKRWHVTCPGREAPGPSEPVTLQRSR